MEIPPTDISAGPPRRRRRWLLHGAWIVPMLMGASYSGISLLSADVLTRPRNHPLVLDPKAISPNARPWSATTADGVTLRGWHHPSADRRRLVVLVHGLWASWHEMAGLGRDLHRRGYDVLLFDLRGHGQSDPSRVSMGRHERMDLRAVLDWAGREGFTPGRIGWVGYSMGGSTLLMEGATNPSIRVVVVDSPFGDLPALLDGQLSRHSGLPHWFNPGILMAARLAFGVRTDDLVPIRSARAWGRRPLLLIHGEADSTVPLRQARSIAGAAGSTCEAVWLPGVEHVEAYRADPVAYVDALDRFFRRNLEP